jgi:hypothetical protein
MTQTNDSELETLKDKYRGKAIGEARRLAMEGIDEAFALGEKAGIAKAEKCVPDLELEQELDYDEDGKEILVRMNTAISKNQWRKEILDNLAKLKNL